MKPTGRLPLDFPRRAYNLIYNEYYRDENLIDEVALTNEHPQKSLRRKTILRRLSHGSREDCAGSPDIGKRKCGFLVNGCCIPGYVLRNGHGAPAQAASTSSQVNLRSSDGTSITSLTNLRADVAQRKAVLTAGNTIDFGDAITFNVSDLRLAFQIQKWLERNARGRALYGVPRCSLRSSSERRKASETGISWWKQESGYYKWYFRQALRIPKARKETLRDTVYR